MATYPSIPNVTSNTDSLRDGVLAAKQTVEIMTGVVGDPLDAMPTWRQLVELGLVLPAQVPTRAGRR